MCIALKACLGVLWLYKHIIDILIPKKNRKFSKWNWKKAACTTNTFKMFIVVKHFMINEYNFITHFMKIHYYNIK